MRTYLLFSVLVHAALGYEPLETVVQWRRLQFAYPTEADRQHDIDTGVFDPDVPAPIDVDVYYPDQNHRLLFVTIPKFSAGVPVTLGLVTGSYYQGDPLIEPFPSWSWHRNASKCGPQRLVSVFRTEIDRCGFLWVLDSGSEGNGIICKPQIVVFDLKQYPWNKNPYYRYEFPSAVYNPDSLFVTLIKESRGSDCKSGAWTYVADTTGRALIVTDMNREYSWRVTHSSLDPEEAFSNFDIAGSTFYLDDGVLGMALSPEKSYFDNDRFLVYSAMSASHESAVTTYDLKHLDYQQPSIYTYNSPRKSQSAAMAVSRTGIAFFGLMSNITINCWNVNSNDYGRYIHTIYENSETMQFASGVKVITNAYGEEELWIMTSRFQLFASTGYDFSEVNFRISAGNVNQLLQGSRCTRPNY